LLEELQALDIEVGREAFDAREIPAWPSQARKESDVHPIMTGHDDDGDGAGRLLGRQSPNVRGGDDHVRFELDEFRGEVRESLDSAMGEFEVEHEVLTLDVAQLPKALDEGIDLRHSRAPCQVADTPDFPRLQRLRGEWRHEDAKREGDSVFYAQRAKRGSQMLEINGSNSCRRSADPPHS